MIRSSTNGPRSLLSLSTDFLFLRLVTLARIPGGNVLWAAVSYPASKISPLTVLLPLHPGPYQDARQRIANEKPGPLPHFAIFTKPATGTFAVFRRHISADGFCLP